MYAYCGIINSQKKICNGIQFATPATPSNNLQQKQCLVLAKYKSFLEIVEFPKLDKYHTYKHKTPLLVQSCSD